ncbi:MAG: hypothetical protein HYW88_03280 [Candidatus Sungbacteria bacterium]|nr:hypothetical protein [Candidatus Sungbacteria bacterium]
MSKFHAIYTAKEETGSTLGFFMSTHGFPLGWEVPVPSPVSCQDVLVVSLEIRDPMIRFMKSVIRNKMTTEHDQPRKVFEMFLRQEMPIIQRHGKLYEFVNAPEVPDLNIDVSDMAEIFPIDS